MFGQPILLSDVMANRNGTNLVGRIRELRVMAEYKSSALFVVEPAELVGEVSHQSLSLSKELSDALYDWIATYDSWLNWDDPFNSPPVPTSVEQAFFERGRELTQLVQAELGSSVVVKFWHNNG